MAADTMAWVREAAAARDVVVLDDATMQSMLVAFVERFVTCPESSWWWQTAAQPATVLRYDDGDGLDVIRRLVGSSPAAYLIVTDQRPEPLGALSGGVDALLAVVADCPLFEFALSDADSRWAIFDTHHDYLVCLGSIAGDPAGT